MFDGPDGVGKTTQIQLVAEDLTTQGYRVHTTRSHGGTPFGEKLREVSLSDIERSALTDYYLSLTMHSALRDDVHARRDAGEIILIDRSPLAIWAYQVFASGLDRQTVEQEIDADMQAFDVDLVIVYEAGLDVLQRHLAQRNQSAKTDYFESKPADYFERVIAGYQFAAARYQATVIDASTTITDVHTASTAAIRTILP